MEGTIHKLHPVHTVLCLQTYAVKLVFFFYPLSTVTIFYSVPFKTPVAPFPLILSHDTDDEPASTAVLSYGLVSFTLAVTLLVIDCMSVS